MVGVFVVGLLVVVASCGSPPGPPANPHGGESIRVVDDDGRAVTLARPPRRVISLVPSATETILALGAGQLLVGRTRYDRSPALDALPLVGGGLDPNLEAVVGLEPELVVTYATDRRAETRSQLDRAGIATIELSLQDTTDAFRAIGVLGTALGIVPRADSLLRRLRDSLAATRRAAQGQDRRRVFYVVYNDPPMTTGPATFIAQILDLAGGINVFADAAMKWPTVSLEQVVRRDPDLVVLPIGEMPARTLERLRSEPGWRDLRAVHRGCVVLVEADLVNRPGPNLARAAEQLRAAIHRDGCGA